MADAPRVSVIIPTYNERPTLAVVLPRLAQAMTSVPTEVVVVDDGSPDGTADFVRSFAGPLSCVVIDRGRKQGLASAVEAGFDRARGEVLVVMDADGSHPPESVPALVNAVSTGPAELAIGSRWVPGGSAPGFPRGRRFLSWGAAVLSRPLVRVKDPMSGFIAFRRRILDRAPLAPVGYKIALEVLVKCRPSPVVEVPIVFRPRIAGESKLGRGEIGQYLRHVGRLYGWSLLRRRASRTR